jgi:hypothetical protein
LDLLLVLTDKLKKDIETEFANKKKKEHYIWYVMPQVEGLGASP